VSSLVGFGECGACGELRNDESGELTGKHERPIGMNLETALNYGSFIAGNDFLSRVLLEGPASSRRESGN